MKRLIAGLSVFLIATVAAAAASERHFVITAAHVLTQEEQAQLADEGVDVQRVLPRDRYLVRASDTSVLNGNPNIRAIEAYGPSMKMTPLARRVATSTRAFVKMNVRFHDDVSVDDARDAVESLGGSIDTRLPLDAKRLTISIPPSRVSSLAADDRVFGIYGPPLKPGRLNSVAASLSHVTPLYGAPYNLDGTGVVLSIHEPSSDCDANGNNCTSAVDATHPEFG